MSPAQPRTGALAHLPAWLDARRPSRLRRAVFLAFVVSWMCVIASMIILPMLGWSPDAVGRLAGVGFLGLAAAWLAATGGVLAFLCLKSVVATERSRMARLTTLAVAAPPAVVMILGAVTLLARASRMCTG